MSKIVFTLALAVTSLSYGHGTANELHVAIGNCSIRMPGGFEIVLMEDDGVNLYSLPGDSLSGTVNISDYDPKLPDGDTAVLESGEVIGNVQIIRGTFNDPLNRGHVNGDHFLLMRDGKHELSIVGPIVERFWDYETLQDLVDCHHLP